MIGVLAAASLLRHRARTALAVAGVAVSAAMVLDMVMLSTGMRESFRSLLERGGFQVRVGPRGAMPFDGEATVGGGAGLLDTLRAIRGITMVAPVLGATLHAPQPGGAVAAFALGVIAGSQGDYVLQEGHEAVADGEVVLNDPMLAAVRRRVGDTLTLATGYDPQLRTFSGGRTLRIAGRVRFRYLAADQRGAALPLATLQAMGGDARRDRLSLVMLRVDPAADVEAIRAGIDAALPRVSALSTATALQQAEQRLSYFRQLAFILGSISLVVGFLLVTTIVTVSVHERVGEIAVMRAIGVSRRHVVQQVVLEGLVLSLAGSAGGLALGLVTARWLDSILATFPGLPESVDFFLFQSIPALAALGMLVLTGLAAGAIPAWRAATLPVAATLRREAVA
ncbi:MAG: ABC transporter permease [Gemmatimonadetes bacterium]|nr:ABC transporter permease [Gemmatimonadota bacterium]